jgi:hypothetical protein
MLAEHTDTIRVRGTTPLNNPLTPYFFMVELINIILPITFHLGFILTILHL